PGMTQIGENLFMDEVLITNSDYAFFMFWDHQVKYPEDTTFFLDYPSDTSYYIKRFGLFSTDFDQYYDNNTEIYRGHPAYMNHPLIGVSMSNAKKYTRWRQHRIMEATLIDAKLIDPNTIRNSPITLEEVLKGEVKFKPTKLKQIAIPILSLPTTEDILIAKRDTSVHYFASKRKKGRQ
ncbi:MAG: hypothetical protein AAF597_06095, partial [Bacteroidota bacterium]